MARLTPRQAIFCFVVVILAIACSDGSNDSGTDPLAERFELKRGPYVQLGGTQSILIRWETNTATSGAVEYGLTQSLDTRIASTDTGTTHSALLTGLQPNTYYYYQIYSHDRPLSKVVRFHTNATPDDTDFSFVVVGDTGEYSEHLFEVSSLINASDSSFALHTGDVVYPHGEEEHYDENFFYPYAQYLATNVLYPTLGNHDIETDHGSAYFNNFTVPANNSEGTENYYSFDYGDAHFIALDTNQSNEPGSAQLAWFERDLAANAKRWKFVFFHESPYSVGSYHVDGVLFQLASESVRRNLVPLFELYGVDVVFSGHSHRYERTFPLIQNQVVDQYQDPNYLNPSGPIYVVTGGGGASLLGPSSNPLNAREIAEHHIVEIFLASDELTGRAISPPGIVVDEFHVMKR